MKKWISLLGTLAIVTPLHAQPVTPPAAQASAMSEGVVRKIDAANAGITLWHGSLVNLDMPPMTMVFRVQPPELLNGVKVGDTVKFRAETIKGAIIVTAIQVAP
ncbi:MAG TPA: copper-binding protein [Thiobacillus sp.]|jgi:Cu/Ag efflux protein CusF|nr:copper-binding protein [Thiobacillus sp.]